MAKQFASQGDMTEKEISFTEVGEGLYAFTAEGDPNSGVIIGDDSVMIIEAQATQFLRSIGTSAPRIRGWGSLRPGWRSARIACS